jgi:hypothetical protein
LVHLLNAKFYDLSHYDYFEVVNLNVAPH